MSTATTVFLKLAWWIRHWLKNNCIFYSLLTTFLCFNENQPPSKMDLKSRCPPSAFITNSNLFGFPLSSFCIIISTHSSWHIFVRSLPDSLAASHERPSSNLSTGYLLLFKSADWGDHGNTFIFKPFMSWCFGPLSCWRIHRLFLFSLLTDAERPPFKNLLILASVHSSLQYSSTGCRHTPSKHQQASTMCNWGNGVPFLIGRVYFSLHLLIMTKIVQPVQTLES